jgi:hypothetical protein
MNATQRFIFVHMPKTGGSFVADVLRQLHGTGRIHAQLQRSPRLLRAKNWLLRQLHGSQLTYEEFDKHGTCHAIPARYAHLPILSCMRNPLDWYVSNYKYGWWRTNPEDYPHLRQDPRWPDQIDFATYMALSQTTWLGGWNPDVVVNQTLGRFTVIFINYYCQDPVYVLSQPADTPNLGELIRENMFPVRFLHTEKLNEELYEYLAEQGMYTAESLAFISNKGKVSPRNQRRSEETWEKFYSPTLLDEVRQRERFLFEMFPFYQW